MDHKKVSYSVPNLKNLVNSSNSCVYCIENCSRSLTVLSVHLSNIKRSVNQLLSDKVTTYDSVLRGIILGHKNIKVINHVQLNDDGNFVLDYVADIYIFKPEVGNHLSGEVNKKSKDHIGVLVHSFFNVSIPRPRNDTECPKNWIGFDVNIGQTVIFEVVKINFSGRLPFIKGKLIDLCEVDFEDRDSGIGGHESMEESTILKNKSNTDEDIKKKKKRKKKRLEDLAHHVNNDNLLEQATIDDREEPTTSEELIDSLMKEADNKMNGCSPEKKKKKKKSEGMIHGGYNDDLQEQDSVGRGEEVGTSEELVDTLIKEADDQLNEHAAEKKKVKKKSGSTRADHVNNNNLQEQCLVNKSEELIDALIKEAHDQLNDCSPEKERKSRDMAGHVYNDNLQEEGLEDRSEGLVTSEELIDALLKEANDKTNDSPEKKNKNKKKKVLSVNEDLGPTMSRPTTEISKSKKRKLTELEPAQETETNYSLDSDEISIPKKKKKKKHSEDNFQE
ncbi:DNA-directed RNA polymerase I subunit RPA43 [Halyomorpha halys]|uniref:DNA-directed RNA polymerase I subunit RPA43 n=1 Tax=Halyomorpha halys TaxID=286706 RepID=UPI0006D5118E|nr:DNA-directed RNA polymerase I subunit RPA43 [Halyomorpha halys]